MRCWLLAWLEPTGCSGTFCSGKWVVCSRVDAGGSLLDTPPKQLGPASVLVEGEFTAARGPRRTLLVWSEARVVSGLSLRARLIDGRCGAVGGGPVTLGEPSVGELSGGLGGWLFARALPRLLRGRRPATALLWALGFGLTVFCQWAGFSAVLALLGLGLALRVWAPGLATRLQGGLGAVWTWAQLLLFALIGAAVDLGPLSQVGPRAAAVVLLGQLGRLAAVLLVTVGSGYSLAERLACALAYLPKATIQAAFAGLPLDRGLPEGTLLLSTAVLAIAITAPLGTIALYRGADALLPRGERRPDATV